MVIHYIEMLWSISIHNNSQRKFDSYVFVLGIHFNLVLKLTLMCFEWDENRIFRKFISKQMQTLIAWHHGDANFKQNSFLLFCKQSLFHFVEIKMLYHNIPREHEINKIDVNSNEAFILLWNARNDIHKKFLWIKLD